VHVKKIAVFFILGFVFNQGREIRIIPNLPDPNNGKIYNLQAGAFSGPASALEMAKTLKSVGFDAVYEVSGSIYRVVVRDIPASMVSFAAQRLGAMGIREIWIKEAQSR